jgi:hypothetical protein
VTSPTLEAIARLRESAAASDSAPDSAEEREEMLDGLDALTALAAGPLPVLTTQHRVIGADTCHFIVPVTLADDLPVPGKLFLTSARLIVAAGGSRAWPWHRIRSITRAGRELFVSGASDATLRITCNNFADALAVEHAARRLGSR